MTANGGWIRGYRDRESAWDDEIVAVRADRDRLAAAYATAREALYLRGDRRCVVTADEYRVVDRDGAQKTSPVLPGPEAAAGLRVYLDALHAEKGDRYARGPHCVQRRAVSPWATMPDLTVAFVGAGVAEQQQFLAGAES